MKTAVNVISVRHITDYALRGIKLKNSHSTRLYHIACRYTRRTLRIQLDPATPSARHTLRILRCVLALSPPLVVESRGRLSTGQDPLQVSSSAEGGRPTPQRMGARHTEPPPVPQVMWQHGAHLDPLQIVHAGFLATEHPRVIKRGLRARTHLRHARRTGSRTIGTSGRPTMHILEPSKMKPSKAGRLAGSGGVPGDASTSRRRRCSGGGVPGALRSASAMRCSSPSGS